MRLNQLLQICICMLFLMPLAALSPSSVVHTGYGAMTAQLRGALARVDGGEALRRLLPSPRSLEFSQANVDRNIRTARNGYRLLRRVTGDSFVKNLAFERLTRRPAAALERLGDTIAAELSKASWANVRRAFDEPLRLPPQLERLLHG